MLKKHLIKSICLAASTTLPFSALAESNARGIIIETDAPLHVADNTKKQTKTTENVVVNNVAGDEIIIEGNKLDFDLDRTLNAYGDAKISQGNKNISGDEIHYDLQNDELSVKGNTHIELGDGHISGPELKMRLNENIGEIKGASIKLYDSNRTQNQPQNTKSSEAFSQSLSNYQNQYIGGKSDTDLALPLTPTKNRPNKKPISSRGDAELVLFEGQNKKHLKNARFTTCEANVDDWYIKATDLKLNDYTQSGVARNAYIEFKGVPFIYTPWLSFSYNQQRKSGLLTPTYGTTSSSGLELLVPYYWNISPNKDATLAARYLGKRGMQLQGEFRYLDPKYSGIASAEFLPSDKGSSEGDHRYFLNLKHQHQLGNGWSAGYGIERVSDDQYFSDLSTRIITTSRVLLPQKFYVNWASSHWRFNGLVQKYQTLDERSFPYERLPQLTLTRNQYIGNLNTNLYSQVVAFKSSNDNVTQTEGVRTTIYPSLSYDFIKPYGFITPKIGLHYTNYQLDNIASNLESQSRTLPIFSLDSGLYFDRDMQFKGNSFVQTLEPRMYYLYIPDKNQDDIPVFDSSLADLNFTTLFSENQFTGNDRINNANQLSFALSTRFLDAKTGAQRLSASIGQRYYFADQAVTLPGRTTSTNNSSDILAGITANFTNHWNMSGFWQYNTDDDTSVRTTISSRYNPSPGKAFNVSYSYRSDLIDQFDISGQWPLGRGWYGVGRMNYSFKESRAIESLAGLEYNAGCWIARTVMQRVSTATADANYALFFQLELGGIASIGANPMSVIKRNIPGYIKTNRIPDNLQQQYYE